MKSPTGPWPQGGAAAEQGSQEGAAQALVDWQRLQGRHGLPWQGSPDPYRVWISEIMLQQTQVSTVLRYYSRFLTAFPDVHRLARASQEEVLSLWSGLGYYSRARHLHRCAQTLVSEHKGEFPRSVQALQSLPGIGASTAAAIASFCWGERVSIFDGNVQRVLARLLGFTEDLAQVQARKKLWQAAQALLPHDAVAFDMTAYTQGLMDLGALLCQPRRVQCERCPWATRCVASGEGQTHALSLPRKTRTVHRKHRHLVWLLLSNPGGVWLELRPQRGVWAGLWSLPEWDSVSAFEATTGNWPGERHEHEGFTHVLTHLDLEIHLRELRLGAEQGAQPLGPWSDLWPAGRWVPLSEALNLGLPAPLRRVLETRSHLGP